VLRPDEVYKKVFNEKTTSIFKNLYTRVQRIDKKTILTGLLISSLFVWNTYLTYTMNKGFKDLARVIVLTGKEIERLDTLNNNDTLLRYIEDLEHEVRSLSVELDKINREVSRNSSDIFWQDSTQRKIIDNQKEIKRKLNIHSPNFY